MSTRVRFRRLGRHEDTRKNRRDAKDDSGIEPSCGLLDVMDEQGAIKWRIIIDCGTTPTGNGGISAPNLTPLRDGRPIDLVLITHAHCDHLGALPALLPFLDRGAVIRMTTPTYVMAQKILVDNLAFAKEGGSNDFDADTVRETLERVRTIAKPGEHEFLPGLKVYVQPEGHINGACSFTLRIGQANVHYTGDRCDHDQSGILGAKPLPERWWPTVIAGSDCTYGATPDSDGRSWQSEMDRAVNDTSAALDQGQRVMFYTFSVHRGGALAHAMQAGRVTDHGHVFLDGSARDFAKMAANGSLKWSGRDQPIMLSRIGMIQSAQARYAVAKMKNFAVIAPPGMGGPGGIGTWWRRLFLPDPQATVAFTGYVAPGTDGDILLGAARERDESGDKNATVRFLETDFRDHSLNVVELPLRCKIIQYRFGGHNSRRNTIGWFRQYKPAVTVLSHGSRGALKSIEDELAGGSSRLIRTDREPDFTLDL